MKIKNLIIVSAILIFISNTAKSAPEADKEVIAPAAGSSTSGIYTNYNVDGLPIGDAPQTNGSYNNSFGYFQGLGFTTVVVTYYSHLDPSNITQGISGGNITDDGGYPILTRGICWSREHNPERGVDFYVDDVAGGAGNFESIMTNLSSGPYYVRAYAITSQGINYGNEVQFVPTLGEWGAIIMGFLVACFGCLFILRQMKIL